MNRRMFALSVAAAFAAPAATSGSKMKLQLSCGSLGVKADQREAIDYASRYGFDVVEADSGYLKRLSSPELQELLEYMKGKKIGWGTAGVPVDFRKDEAAFRATLRDLPEHAKALQAAGVRLVTTWLSPGSKELTYLANFRTHAARLREIARVLRDHELRYGLEYVGPKTAWSAQRYPFIKSMVETKELLAEINQPNTGLVLDSWHWFNAGESAADIAALTAKDVVSVDLNDAPAGIPLEQQVDSKRELPGATGVIDSTAFLRALAQIGFEGPVRAEPFNAALRAMAPEAALQTTIASLKKAFAAV